jgi:hypothetical protein
MYLPYTSLFQSTLKTPLAAAVNKDFATFHVWYVADLHNWTH